MNKSYKVTERNLGDYKKDKANANRGTARGEQMIAASFEEVGALRSIAADNQDVLLAGNQSIEGARKAGITKVIEIETEGDVLIVHKRRDLDANDARGRRAAYYDNRTNQIDLDFDPAVLLDDQDLLDGLWRADELEKLLENQDAERTVSDALTEGERVAYHRPKQVKVVLYTDQVATFERAISAAGIYNRGDALMAVSQFYLDHHDAS